MFCKQCGKELDVNMQKCAHCGTTVGKGGRFCADCGRKITNPKEPCICRSKKIDNATAINSTPINEQKTNETESVDSNGAVFRKPATSTNINTYQDRQSGNVQERKFKNPVFAKIASKAPVNGTNADKIIQENAKKILGIDNSNAENSVPVKMDTPDESKDIGNKSITDNKISEKPVQTIPNAPVPVKNPDKNIKPEVKEPVKDVVVVSMGSVDSHKDNSASITKNINDNPNTHNKDNVATLNENKVIDINRAEDADKKPDSETIREFSNNTEKNKNIAPEKPKQLGNAVNVDYKPKEEKVSNNKQLPKTAPLYTQNKNPEVYSKSQKDVSISDTFWIVGVILGILGIIAHMLEYGALYFVSSMSVAGVFSLIDLIIGKKKYGFAVILALIFASLIFYVMPMYVA